MIDYKTTWRKELEKALAEQKESWADIEALMFHETRSLREPYLITRTKARAEGDFVKPFHRGMGRDNVFTAWTKKRVYYEVQQEDGEWVDSVSRNPE